MDNEKVRISIKNVGTINGGTLKVTFDDLNLKIDQETIFIHDVELNFAAQIRRENGLQGKETYPLIKANVSGKFLPDDKRIKNCKLTYYVEPGQGAKPLMYIEPELYKRFSFCLSDQICAEVNNKFRELERLQNLFPNFGNSSRSEPKVYNTNIDTLALGNSYLRNNINTLFDLLLKNLVTLLSRGQLGTINIPDAEGSFKYNWLISGSFEVYEGQASNLSRVYRNGDFNIDLTDEILTLEFELKAPKLKLHYGKMVGTVVISMTFGDVYLTIDEATIRMKIEMDMRQDPYVITLKDLKTTLSGIEVDLSSLPSSFQSAAGTVKEQFPGMMEDTLKKLFNKYLDALRNLFKDLGDNLMNLDKSKKSDKPTKMSN
uniref:Uncharacterized protein n=1 Tax=Trichogramma kaykai TaxID=54128 RepID=A0ABD2VTY3_9HYME